MTELETELRALIVEVLNLEDVAPEDIDPEEDLFSEDGLALDSIDALEIAFAISETYGFKLRSDDERNQEIFSCVRALASHIAENRKT